MAHNSYQFIILYEKRQNINNKKPQTYNDISILFVNSMWLIVAYIQNLFPVSVSTLNLNFQMHVLLRLYVYRITLSTGIANSDRLFIIFFCTTGLTADYKKTVDYT